MPDPDKPTPEQEQFKEKWREHMRHEDERRKTPWYGWVALLPFIALLFHYSHYNGPNPHATVEEQADHNNAVAAH